MRRVLWLTCAVLLLPLSAAAEGRTGATCPDLVRDPLDVCIQSVKVDTLWRTLTITGSNLCAGTPTVKLGKDWLTVTSCSADGASIVALLNDADEGQHPLAVYVGGDRSNTVSVKVGELAGPPGPPGPAGPMGPAGPSGPQGPKGDAGATGAAGPPGPKGDTGATGAAGPSGPAGPRGDPGQAGVAGPRGSTGDTGDGLQAFTEPPGSNCTAGGVRLVATFNGVASSLPEDTRYVCAGEPGIQGIQGPQGDQGLQGIAGPPGVRGDTGEQGPIGPTGAMGPPGPSGPAGPTGPKGDPAVGAVPMCPAGQLLVSSGSAWTCGLLCASAVTNPLTDGANCGSCGNACPSTWSCNAGTCIAAEMSFPVALGPYEVMVAGTHVWTAHRGTSRLTKLNANDGTVLGSYNAPQPTGLVFDGSSVWTACGLLLRSFRESDGAALGSYPIPDRYTTAMAFDGANLWLVSSGGLVTKVRTSDGTVLATYALGGSLTDVTFDGANVWTVSYAGVVTKLRGSDGYVLGTFSVGGAPEGIASDGTGIWVTWTGSGTVSRLRASDGGVIGTYSLGYGIIGKHFAFDGTNTYVTAIDMVNWVGKVVVLSSADGSVVRSYDLSGEPWGIAFDGTSMWVTLPGQGSVRRLPLR